MAMLDEKLRARIIERDGKRCGRCGSRKSLTVDHKIPTTKGGTDDEDNLWTLCLSCNAQKGNSLDERWLRPPTEEELEQLARLRRAHAKVQRRRREYHKALLDARAAGHSFGELAEAAGVSRQAMQQLMRRIERL